MQSQPPWASYLMYATTREGEGLLLKATRGMQRDDGHKLTVL